MITVGAMCNLRNTYVRANVVIILVPCHFMNNNIISKDSAYLINDIINSSELWYSHSVGCLKELRWEILTDDGHIHHGRVASLRLVVITGINVQLENIKHIIVVM